MSSEGNNAKPRRRATAKPSSLQDVRKVKLTLYLDADLAKRFAVHAEMMEQDKSELFAAMVRTHCRRFVVHDRGGDAGASAEAGTAEDRGETTPGSEPVPTMSG